MATFRNHIACSLFYLMMILPPGQLCRMFKDIFDNVQSTAMHALYFKDFIILRCYHRYDIAVVIQNLSHHDQMLVLNRGGGAK